VTFLLKYNGVVSNDAFNEIYLKDINENVNVDVIYGIDTGNDASNIEYWTNAYIDDLFGSTVIIGDSIQHGFFVLVCDGSNDGVYYYDDSYSLSSSDDENNVYFIANTFDEFFTLLYN
ncbi:SMI1/KNR4 family protein, partial [[Clostridium] innocuum]